MSPRANVLALLEVAKSRLRYSLDASVAHDLTTIVTLARAALAELPATIPPPNVDAQLEAAARSDADELPRRLTPSRFDQAAAAAKRPSGMIAAVRDTDPAPPPESR